MNRSMKLVPGVVVLGLTLLFPVLAGCRAIYSAKAITAHVIDAETKQPLEGVIVVAHWQLTSGGEKNSDVGQIMVLETVTDQTGMFHFPAWGPKKVPPPITINAQLENHDPEILFFKDGYQFTFVSNNDLRTDSDYRKQSLRTSQYDGKTIEMRKVEGVLPAGWMTDMYFHLKPLEAYCAWRNMPLLLAVLRKQTEALRRQGDYSVTFYDDLVSNEQYEAKSGCGSVRQFVEEHAN